VRVNERSMTQRDAPSSSRELIISQVIFENGD
jgi:hypothetical protein